MATAKPKLDPASEKDLKKYFENPLERVCESCGLDYDNFETGENYQSVYDSLWKASDDPADWLNKGRHTVLGRWHEIKQEMWRDHLEQCSESGGGSEIEYDDDDGIDEY